MEKTRVVEISEKALAEAFLQLRPYTEIPIPLSLKVFPKYHHVTLRVEATSIMNEHPELLFTLRADGETIKQERIPVMEVFDLLPRVKAILAGLKIKSE